MPSSITACSTLEIGDPLLLRTPKNAEFTSCSSLADMPMSRSTTEATAFRSVRGSRSAVCNSR